MFSVVIPLYNKRDHILRTLESVFRQTLAPFEIIVVDDGSTDDGADCVSRLGRKNVRLIRKRNGGVSSARNAGISAVTTEWVTFLDADDVWLPGYLQEISGLARRHPDADMVGTYYRSVSAGDHEKISAWKNPENAGEETIGDLPLRWLSGTCFFTSSIAVRLSALKRQPVHFPPGESYGEDIDLWFRLAEYSDVVLSRAPLVARMWVPGGLSATGAGMMNDPPYIQRMVERVDEAGKGLDPQRRISLRNFVRHRWVSLARTAISAGDRRTAIALLVKSRRYGMDRRWVVTAVMALAVPSAIVEKWQQWRKRRKMLVG